MSLKHAWTRVSALRFGYGRARARTRGGGSHSLEQLRWRAVSDLASVAKAKI